MKTLRIVKNCAVTKNAEIKFTVAKSAFPSSDLVMLIKTPPLFFMCLSSVLFLCSCDKHKLLMAERDQVESETKRMLEETKSLDSKFFSLGNEASTASLTLQMNNRDLAYKNTLMEQELATLSKKCSEGEEMVKALRPRLESYKAKFVR